MLEHAAVHFGVEALFAAVYFRLVVSADETVTIQEAIVSEIEGTFLCSFKMTMVASVAIFFIW